MRRRRQRGNERPETLKPPATQARLQIALCLRDAKEPVCICDFTASFDISQPTVSHHMAKLREAGLVDVTKRGIWSFYRLAPALPPATPRVLDAIGLRAFPLAACRPAPARLRRGGLSHPLPH